MGSSKYIIYLITALFLCQSLNAQDKVYLRSGKVVETNVIRLTEKALIAEGSDGLKSYDTGSIKYVFYKNGILDRVSKKNSINRSNPRTNAYTSYKLQMSTLPKSVWVNSYSVFMGYEVDFSREGFGVEFIKWFKNGFGLKAPLFFGSARNDFSVISSIGIQYIISTNPYRRVSFDASGGVSVVGYSELLVNNVATTNPLNPVKQETEYNSGNSFGVNLELNLRLKLIGPIAFRSGLQIFSSPYSNSAYGGATDVGAKIGLEYNLKPKKVGIQKL
jgi:hypothetical protein